MVKFVPLTKDQASRVLPKGNYAASVESCEAKKSKKGSDMFVVKLKVYGDDKTIIVDDYLLTDGPMGFKLRHFCELIGKLEDYDAGELYPETFVGCNVKVKVAVEEAGEFPEKNVVKGYVTDKPKADKPEDPPGVTRSQQKAVAKAKAEGNLPDEIPF